MGKMPSYLDNKVRFFVRNQLFPRNFLNYPLFFPGVSYRSGYLSSHKNHLSGYKFTKKITESRICLFSKQILLSFVIKIASQLREISQSLSKNLTLSSKSLAYTPFPYAGRQIAKLQTHLRHIMSCFQQCPAASEQKCSQNDSTCRRGIKQSKRKTAFPKQRHKDKP